MQILDTLLTVVFIIISIVLVLLILVQNNRSGGMGLFGGSGSQSAFGASSADVITKLTSFLVALFMIVSLSMAYLKSQQSGYAGIQKEFQKPADTEQSDESKMDSESNSNENNVDMESEKPSPVHSDTK